MPSTADRLRRLHSYAATHRVVDLGLLLEAADVIDELERDIQGLQADNAEWERLAMAK